ncbi:reverse transcriptase domain-containing protein [Deinococcus ficus]|uniref:Reverse transcriptase domain-containing protein n=1 Tax=Deinococcus ficus TaxID=317577 RepID=A0A221SZS0_9DEIO|nr:reverse transcriptase domain-containing protein [Deinococcus ficus]ASN82158.1 hypothetical protein DFI_10345 [Deinococcus ficus]
MEFSLFLELFDIESFYKRAITKPSTGRDGIGFRDFAKVKDAELDTIIRKVDKKCYKFTPYNEILVPKRYDSTPRRLAIPTIRDRVLLTALKDYIAYHFPEYSSPSHQHVIIRAIQDDVLRSGYVLKTDFKNYYDSIPHDKLLLILRSRIVDPYAIKIIEWAVNNHIFPSGFINKKPDFYRSEGLPQGIPISNILANIYGGAIDHIMLGRRYYRYMDDIIIFSDSREELEIVKSELNTKSSSLGLTINSEKTAIHRVAEGFEFLGYEYDGRNFSIKFTSLDKHYRKLADMMRRLEEDISGKNIRYRGVPKNIIYNNFLDDLNTHITGAIYKGKKLGFTFYFSLSSSLSQFYALDNFIEVNLGKYNRDFPDHIPIRRHVQACIRWKHNNPEGYIKNFDVVLSTEERFDYLTERGILAPPIEQHTAEQVNQTYERYVRNRLRSLGSFSGNVVY